MDAPVSEMLPGALASRRSWRDKIGDKTLYGVSAVASLVSLFLIGLLVYKVFEGAWPSIQSFGLPFVWNQVWNENATPEEYGALSLIYGTAITSGIALVFAAPLSIAIGLYLSELAPGGVRGVVGALIEMLAAIPSVIIGLWGILVLGPFVQNHLEPFLSSFLGWTPFFRGSEHTGGLLPAMIVLTIMIIPISSAVCRELFLTVPTDLKEGAYGLGLTRWEMTRGVILPYTRGGVVAAILLGLGRALGEAIAVTQVIGNQNVIHVSWFDFGNTLASNIANKFQGASYYGLEPSALFYCAAILLVFALIVNVSAQVIVKRFELKQGR
jgi:phosphate transport system permease protein